MGDQTALLSKLHEAAKAISFIEKRGQNDHHHYSFVQAVDVVAKVREELLSRNVVVIPSATAVEHKDYTASRGGAAFLTTVKLSYSFRDVETGEAIEVPWIGVGADTGGDKGVYKAFTGGLKSALLSLFLIPTSDDPERDQLTESESTPHPDDARPAAPPIPLDRAQSILQAAITLGLAEEDGSVFKFKPVFKAVLATAGVEKIGELNVDQAESVEAFLVAEHRATSGKS